MASYEVVFAITPIVAPETANEVAAKFRKMFADVNCKIVHEENWGLVGNEAGRAPGYYRLFEFQAPDPSVIKTLESGFRRDEWICYHKIVKLS